MPRTEYDVRELEDGDIDSVLPMLTSAFGIGFDRDWFDWKHRSSPWGASRGWVAEDAHGLIGVRMLLPWEFTGPSGSLRAYRPCDTVVHPRARGQGVFTRLMRHAIETVRSDADLLYNTPNTQSRPGYFKLGFVKAVTVDQRLGFVRSRVADVADPIPAPMNRLSRHYSTRLNSEFIDWRYRYCPRYDYRLLGLRGETVPNGVVCRLRRAGRLPILVLSELWGPDSVKKLLVGLAAAVCGVNLVRLSSADRRLVPVSIPRGGTVVTKLQFNHATSFAPKLSIGDIEDVI